jgi:hypothetical protein
VAVVESARRRRDMRVGVDLTQGRSDDAEEASEHDAVTTGASSMVGVELCGRPVPAAISRG